MADDLGRVLKDHLGTTDDSISIQMLEVPLEHWKRDVYDVDISPIIDKLIKKPSYGY